MIIHIAGVSGSGKTYMSNELQKLGLKNIVFIELDDLYRQYKLTIKRPKIETYEKDMQKIIDNVITENETNTIIFVGLNINFDSTIIINKRPFKVPQVFLNLYADTKFFIDIDINIALRRKFYRNITELYENKESYFDSWLKNNNSQFVINKRLNINSWLYKNNGYIEIYKNKNYNIQSYENIKQQIIDLVS